MNVSEEVFLVYHLSKLSFRGKENGNMRSTAKKVRTIVEIRGRGDPVPWGSRWSGQLLGA